MRLSSHESVRNITRRKSQRLSLARLVASLKFRHLKSKCDLWFAGSLQGPHTMQMFSGIATRRGVTKD